MAENNEAISLADLAFDARFMIRSDKLAM